MHLNLRDVPSEDFSGRIVAVTGGAGFIGSHLVEALLARGARVRVLDDFSSGRRGHLPAAAGLEVLAQDVRDAAACDDACRGAHLAFHLAALGSVPRSLADPVSTLAVNVQGSATLFDAARRAGVSRVVYASSSSVYGDSPALPKREGEEGEPLSPYAASKRLAEELAGVFGRSFGLPAVGLRYFNVYGPRQDPEGPYAAVVPCFFREILAGRPPTVFGDGEQSRDFTWVGDAVEATLLAAAAPESACGAVYNVAGGRAVTINRLAAMVGETLGRPLAPRYAPARPGDVRHSAADLTRARTALGYRPRTDLERGLGASRSHYERIFARDRSPGAARR